LLLWQAIIHTMFPDLCNIARSLSKVARAKLLNTVKPLESGEAYEVVEGEKIWHPMWEGKVDDAVNAAFIQEIVDLVWDNEKVRTNKRI
jgi:hypothetical protein